MKLDRVLVPVDGSKESEKALDMAKQMAEKFGCEILVLNVIEVFRGNAYYYNFDYIYSQDFRIYEESSQNTLKTAEARLQGIDNVRLLSCVGHPSEEIISKSIEEDVDLIIMATHGMSGLKRYLIGSVTNNVIHHSKIPVLVLP